MGDAVDLNLFNSDATVFTADVQLYLTKISFGDRVGGRPPNPSP